ncbi:hypothetical protein BRARA_A02466 [Brassica rapa]|nr:cyclic nucleotide-gated ion channel 11 [Brassica rapa]RID79755.1 hypothetical protein BRARA_A02466 [Brassica rapa]
MRFHRLISEQSVASTSVRGRLKKIYKNMKTLNTRKIVLLVCLVALAIDPLFLFIPVIDSHRLCFTYDKKLVATACVFRTLIDTFYGIHIIFHFITKHIAPRSQVSFRGETTVYSVAISERHLIFYFIVDIVSVLPIPQIMVLSLIKRSDSLVSKKILKYTILSQYIPRSIRIYPLFKEVSRSCGTVAETKWIGASLNLFLYMLQSYVFGAFWYLSAIEKKNRCWSDACAKSSMCNLTNLDLYCVRGGGDNSHFLKISCPLIDPGEITNSTVFNFGMYIDALKSGVVESRDFPRKFFYCFWWGLRNLSALGQNLETSNSVGEIFFAITICVSGLLLFSVLIGNVQKYLQSTIVRINEMEEKRRDTEKWMSYRMLPESLKERIRKSEDHKWRETRGTKEESFLRGLPKNLRLEIERQIYQKLLKHMPWFEDMDDRLLDSVCARLKTVIYTEDSYIVDEGEQIENMLFINRGTVIVTEKKTTFFRSVGEFCGEELLSWALLDPHSSCVPISSMIIKARTEVEGFVLSADDLKFVAAQYCRLHRKKARHISRLHSRKWRNWAACFIQAAWTEYCRRKLSKDLGEEEAKLHSTIQKDDSAGNTHNLGGTAFASRLASTVLRNLRVNASRKDRVRQISLPEKPVDPKFPMDEI